MKIKATQVVSIASVLVLMLVPLLGGGVKLEADIPFALQLSGTITQLGADD